MEKNRSFFVQGSEIHISTRDDGDYISLTDMAQRFGDSSALIKKWLSNKNTLEFIGVWERLNNPSFNLAEFGLIKADAGSNRFVMSSKQWIERTGGTGLVAKTGRYGSGSAGLLCPVGVLGMRVL